jgi:DNA polymerase-3 subunit gamma/tau
VKLQECAQEFPVEALIHALDTLQDALEALKRSASGRVGMEVCLLRLCNPELDSSNTALLRRIKILEDKIASGSFATASHTQAAPDRLAVAGNNAANVRTSMEEKAVPAGADSNSTLPTKEGIPSSDSSADEPLNNWAEVLEALRKADAPLFGVLKTSSAIIRGGFVLIDPNNAMFSDLIRGQEHRKPLVEAVRRITGKPYKVGIFKKSMEKPAAQAEDPMDELADNASRAGIDVEQH